MDKEKFDKMIAEALETHPEATDKITALNHQTNNQYHKNIENYTDQMGKAGKAFNVHEVNRALFAESGTKLNSIKRDVEHERSRSEYNYLKKNGLLDETQRTSAAKLNGKDITEGDREKSEIENSDQTDSKGKKDQSKNTPSPKPESRSLSQAEKNNPQKTTPETPSKEGRMAAFKAEKETIVQNEAKKYSDRTGNRFAKNRDDMIGPQKTQTPKRRLDYERD